MLPECNSSASFIVLMPHMHGRRMVRISLSVSGRSLGGIGKRPADLNGRFPRNHNRSSSFWIICLLVLVDPAEVLLFNQRVIWNMFARARLMGAYAGVLGARKWEEANYLPPSSTSLSGQSHHVVSGGLTEFRQRSSHCHLHRLRSL